MDFGIYIYAAVFLRSAFFKKITRYIQTSAIYIYMYIYAKIESFRLLREVHLQLIKLTYEDRAYYLLLMSEKYSVLARILFLSSKTKLTLPLKYNHYWLYIEQKKFALNAKSCSEGKLVLG